MTDKTDSKSKKGLKTIAKQLAKSAKLHAAQSKKVMSFVPKDKVEEISAATAMSAASKRAARAKTASKFAGAAADKLMRGDGTRTPEKQKLAQTAMAALKNATTQHLKAEKNKKRADKKLDAEAAEFYGKNESKSSPRIPRKPGQPAGSKKHSDLYTDENPKGTIHGLGFKDVDTAKSSVSKIRNSSRSHAHKIQAAVAMEQRAREMGKSSEAAVYRKFIDSMKKKTKSVNEDLRKWVQQRWVDIGAPKKGGGFKPCGRQKGEKRKGYPKCVPAAKAARMSKSQRRSAVKRKRAAGNPGGKPTMVSTFKKRAKKREAFERLGQIIEGKLCPKGKAAAKRKFAVYPSAYANMYASAVCSGKVTPGGKKGKKK